MLSLEYLMLFLISVSLLSVSVYSLIHIRDFAESQFSMLEFRSSVNDLGNAMNEVCSLGNGNSRVLFIRNSISVETDDGVAEFTGSGYSMVKESLCDAEAADIKGMIMVENREGIIRIREQ